MELVQLLSNSLLIFFVMAFPPCVFSYLKEIHVELQNIRKGLEESQ